jgi:hypothetical protein
MLISRANREALDLCSRCPLAFANRRMSMGPVTLAKLAKAHSALYNGCFSSQDVPGGSVTSGVAGSASRIPCDDPLPVVPGIRPLWGWPNGRQRRPSLDEVVVTYRDSDTGSREEYEGAALCRWRDNGPGADVTGAGSDLRNMVSLPTGK